MIEDEREIVEWVNDYFNEDKHQNLIGALQALQGKFGYLPKIGRKAISARLNMSPANVHAVATFYNQFRFVPPGKYPIKVCLGTACVVSQGKLILDHWKRRLGIDVGEVTEDMEYSLDRVDCVGCCTLAPVTIIGEETLGKMAVTRVDGILLQHKIHREQEARRVAAEKTEEDKSQSEQ